VGTTISFLRSHRFYEYLCQSLFSSHTFIKSTFETCSTFATQTLCTYILERKKNTYLISFSNVFSHKFLKYLHCLHPSKSMVIQHKEFNRKFTFVQMLRQIIKQIPRIFNFLSSEQSTHSFAIICFVFVS